ncbi:MAG TPA: CHAD domain-containing protein, partial [Gemmataceae bacterium]
MAGGKWIDGLAPTTPVRSAARAVLGQRFERVAKYLRRVGQAGVPGPENVHQLRVATRRAAAALSVFKASLPRKYRRGARKLLREIRRTASAARDWDVFAARFAPPGDGPGAAAGGARDALLGYALARRADAQAALDELARRCGGEWEAVCAGLPEAVQSPREGPVDLADHARDVLAPLFESLCEAAERPPASFEGMHAVRILGKKLRYAMEIFADCHAPPFRERLYPAVEAMQETLGALNDSLTG